MEEKQKRIEQTQKNIILVLILGIIAIGLLGFYAFSKYITSVEGQGEAQIAKWSFIVNGQTSDQEEIDLNLTINPNNNVASGKVAPGTSGSFKIEIDATKSEVALSYAIEMDLKQTPHNLTLYSNYEDGVYSNPITVENNTAIIKGHMSLDDVKEVKTKTIYWEWPYQTGTEDAEIEANDKQDTDDSVNSSMKIGVTVTGTEKLEPPVYAKEKLVIKNNNSPYVKYIDKSGEERLCRVLYNDETHGLQIITEGSVETVGLGTVDANYSDLSGLEKAKKSYYNAVENLNAKAEGYKNDEIVADARCVGSLPTLEETGERFADKNHREPLKNPYPSNSSYNYLNDYIDSEKNSINPYPGIDTNYDSDFTQMGNLKIHTITNSPETSNCYWLASRYVSIGSSSADFNVRFVYSSGSVHTPLFSSGGNTGNASLGFRPVFLLKSNVEVIKGDGTSASPYILGIN